MRYEYMNHFGGVILTDSESGREIFLQPGDDSRAFLDEYKKIDWLFYSGKIVVRKYGELVNNLFDSYFSCIENN